MEAVKAVTRNIILIMKQQHLTTLQSGNSHVLINISQ